jgi:hypothetical protein
MVELGSLLVPPGLAEKKQASSKYFLERNYVAILEIFE